MIKYIIVFITTLMLFACGHGGNNSYPVATPSAPAKASLQGILQWNAMDASYQVTNYQVACQGPNQNFVVDVGNNTQLNLNGKVLENGTWNCYFYAYNSIPTATDASTPVTFEYKDGKFYQK